MNTKEINKAISKIATLSESICQCDNNLQYIKRLKALQYWLLKFDSLLNDESRLKGEFSAIYESYFCTGCGHSFFDKISLSICDYQYGNRPF